MNQFKQIKIKPEYYKAVLSGLKTFEIRKDDRNYQVGDTVCLNEWDGGDYTGRYTKVTITYVLRDVPEYGLMPGYCIFGWRQ